MALRKNSNGRAEDVIRAALARALFDAPPDFCKEFARGFGTGPRGFPPNIDLARRIVAELHHAGYFMKEARSRSAWKWAATGVRARMDLEDHIADGVGFAPKEWCAKLNSPDLAEAGNARKIVTEKICEALNLAQVIMARRKDAMLRDRYIEAALSAAIETDEVKAVAQDLSVVGLAGAKARKALAAVIVGELDRLGVTVSHPRRPPKAFLADRLEAAMTNCGESVVGLLASSDRPLQSIGIERVTIAATHIVTQSQLELVKLHGPRRWSVNGGTP